MAYPVLWFLCFWAATISSGAYAACSDPVLVRDSYDLIIIGGGMAGLSAGKTIREHDPNLTFVILETQQDRVGGRVRSNTEWFKNNTDNGTVVEEGANWFSDIPGNPGLSLANRYGVDLFVQDFEDFRRLRTNHMTYGCFLLSKNATLVDSRVVDGANQYFFSKAYQCVQKEALKLYKKQGNPNYDPLSDGVQNVQRSPCGWDNVTNLDWFLDWLYNGYEFAEYDTSMYSYPNRKYFNSKFYLVKDQDMGFEKLPKMFANEYLLSEGSDSFVDSDFFMFGQEVRRIYYDLQERDRPVAVETNFDENGCPAYRFEAFRAINTVGAGVIRKEYIEYVPELRYSVNESFPYEMADYVKVFYEFKTKFWNVTDDREFIVSLRKTGNDGRCVYWQSWDYSIGQNKGQKQTSPDIVPGSKILFCSLLTEAFQTLLAESGQDELTEDQLKGELLDPLRKVFPDVDFEQELVKVRYPSLHTNPCFFGSYENWQVGYDLTDFYHWHGGILPGSEPIVQPCEHNGCTANDTWTLQFSGSGSCLADYGFVRGAINAGERNAKYVLADIGCGGDGCDIDTSSSCDAPPFVNNGNNGRHLRH